MAWGNMLTAMTSSALVAAIPMMLKLTDVFNSMSTFANANPQAMLYIAEGITALGIALTVGGAVALAAALGSVGWIAAAIVGAGAAVFLLVDRLKGLDLSKLFGGVGDWFSKEMPHVAEAFRWIADAAAKALGPLQSIANVLARFLGIGGGGGAVGTPSGEHNGTIYVPGGEGMPATTIPGKQGYNAVPPSGGSSAPTRVSMIVDGRVLGEVVTRRQSDAANGPLNGSAFFDGSAAFVPADYSFARG
jgi:hypothetical protein